MAVTKHFYEIHLTARYRAYPAPPPRMLFDGDAYAAYLRNGCCPAAVSPMLMVSLRSSVPEVIIEPADACS